MNPWKKQSIITYPSPILSLPTKRYPFERGSAEDSYFLSGLRQSLRMSCPENGAAVAANQIGYPLRVYYEKATDRLYINPEIISHGGTKVNDSEACLSFPGISVDIKRWKNVVVRYQDDFAQFHEETMEGFRARVAQHEIEHLDGKTFLDRFDFRKRQAILAGRG